MSRDRIHAYIHELSVAGVRFSDRSPPFTPVEPVNRGITHQNAFTRPQNLDPARPKRRLHTGLRTKPRPARPQPHEQRMERVKTLDNVLAQSMIWLRDNQLEIAGAQAEREEDARHFSELISDRDPIEDKHKWSDLKNFKLLGEHGEGVHGDTKYNFRALDAAQISAVDVEIRALALEYGVNIQTIERIRRTFDFFDEDGSGSLESEEIKPLILSLLKVKNVEDFSVARLEFLVRQFVGKDNCCTFANFLANYLRLFGSSERSAPEKAFYSTLNPLHAAIASLAR